MPNRVQWNPGYEAGSDILDNQHQDILARCNALADCVVGTSQEDDRKFRELFNELMDRAHEHFSTEEDVLARGACATLDECRYERDEFDFLVAEIATTENFDKLELQRFLALWWVGHIIDSGKRYRACIAR